MKRIMLFAVFFILFSAITIGQNLTEIGQQIEAITENNDNTRHRLDVLEKMIDDLRWHANLDEWAYIDKQYIVGPPRWKDEDKDALGYGNPLKFWVYIFIPKGLDPEKEYPLMLLPHGGVHGDFTTYYTHIVIELVSQGYVVAAPEYRGSTGYGRSHYENIDYGGLENEDVFAARNHMLETYDFLDKNRVGIMGWSHGGMITLMNIFDHPDAYQAAFAGVPVSDIISRMGYQTQSYRDLYSADYHIGATAHDNLAEYRRRSPAWQTHKFRNTPLLIHTNTNDDDVNVLEVEHLIKSLKADGKKFEYEIFQEAPGGHSFDRIDIKNAKEIRVKIYKHLAKVLEPENPITSLKDLQKAGYKY